MGFARVVWTITRRLAILLVLVTAFTGSTLLAIYLSRAQDVAVPKLVGRSQKEAAQVAGGTGLKVEVIEIFDEKEKTGIVVRQEPKAGMVVKKGFTVKIYLSKGTNRTHLKSVKTGGQL